LDTLGKRIVIMLMELSKIDNHFGTLKICTDLDEAKDTKQFTPLK